MAAKMLQQVVHGWMFGAMPMEKIAETLRRIGADGMDLSILEGQTESMLKTDVKGILANEGLTIPVATAQYVAMDLSHCDEAKRQAAIDHTKRCIDVTAAAGCDRMLVAPSAVISRPQTYFTTRQEDFARSADSIRQAAEYAKACGVMLLIEPINRYRVSLIRTVGEGLELVEAVGMPNVHLVPDVWHMHMEEDEGVCAGILQAGTHLKCLHIGDNTRKAPGHGYMDWRAILQALYQIGFDGPLSYEPVFLGYNGGLVGKDEAYTELFAEHLRVGISYLHGIMEALIAIQ